jgi:tetratricopeptide (TPR) repeat protein
MKKIVLILLSFTIFAVNSFAESGNLSKGLKLYDDSKYSQAKPYFEKIVALNNEETGEAYFYLAEIAYFTLAEPKNDVEHERLLRLSIAKDYIPAITHLGGYISDAKEGEKILLAGLEKFPNDESIIEGLTDVYYGMGITDKTVNFYEQLGAKGNSKAYLNLGYLYQDDKQYNLAEENFLKAANNNVEGSKLVLADFYKSQKKYDLAEKYYLEVKAEDSVDGLAELYIIQKKYDLVEKLFQDSGKYDRQEILSIIAGRAFYIEDYVTAEKYYLQEMKENPNSFYNQIPLAQSAEKAGDNSLAEEMYKKDIVSNSGGVSTGDYVNFMLKQGKLAEVEKFVEENKGTEIETSIYGALLSNYFDAKNVEGIKKYSQKLIDLKDESYRYEMGYAYYLEKNYSEATKNFLIAKKSLNFTQDSLYYLGMIEKEKGNMKEAKAYFLKVYKKDRYYSIDLLNELKSIYEKEGNTEEIKQIQEYIDDINNSNDDTDY